MVDIKLGESDRELKEALEIATDAATNGSVNGRAVAARVIEALAPLLVAAPDPRIKALGLGLVVASRAFLSTRRKGGSRK